MDLQKLLKIVAIVIGVISIYFLGDIISTGNDQIRAGEGSIIVNMFMYVSYIVLAIAVLIVLVFSVLNLVSNTEGLKHAYRRCCFCSSRLALLLWFCQRCRNTPQKWGYAFG